MSTNPESLTIEREENKTSVFVHGLGFMEFKRGTLKSTNKTAIYISSSPPFLNPQAKDRAFMYLGTEGLGGAITVRDDKGREVFNFDGENAVLDIGGKGNEGDIRVYDKAGKVRVHLDGNEGDIKLLGADCSENFDVEEVDELEAGSVLVIGEHGKLHACAEAYDKKVAGIISGAGNYKPGIVLDKQNDDNGRRPIALSGKVYCKADANFGSIEIGDLLTTSSTSGHAMKASDPLKAFGAVIGKALQPLKAGRGLVPVIVALQ